MPHSSFAPDFELPFMRRLRLPLHWFAVIYVASLAVACAQDAGNTTDTIGANLPGLPPLRDVSTLLPSSPDECDAMRLQQIVEAADQYADQVGRITELLDEVPANQVLPLVKRMLLLDRRVDAAVERLLPLRTQFEDAPEQSPKRKLVRNYLGMCQQLVTLNGKLNYQQRDALDAATYRLASDLKQLSVLIQELTEARSIPGAVMLAFVLEVPDPATKLKPYPKQHREAVLQLMKAARSLDTLPALADFLEDRGAAADQRLQAAEVMRHIGIPQDPHPFQDPSIGDPRITAKAMLKIVESLDISTSEAKSELPARRDALAKWLRERVERGVMGDEFRIGRIAVREGDWFLMRNPSPFNQFTDLAPGLFTHVGIVTTMVDRGVRRFVVTDIPERGDRVPATNVDAYLQPPLHYLFLRHKDEKVNLQMAKAAADTIGNPSQFDLLFRTDRVAELKGKSLQGELVHTYCAGYLLLCAQQTGLARTEFFPIREFSPSHQCQQNMAKLGLRLGANYISPTGPLFSKNHIVVGGRKPNYSPDRELLMAIYSHFGERMANRELTPSPDLFQSLRSKVAGLSRYNPWLAKALAKANNVSPRMDLKAAAQAAAVIETLDEIANRATHEFRLARSVLMYTDVELRKLPPDDVARIGEFRRRHAKLDKMIEEGQISPRQLRMELVRYYTQVGKDGLDARFFGKGPIKGN